MTDKELTQKRISKNLILLLLTLFLLIAAAVAWYLSMTVVSTSGLGFLSPKMEFQVSVSGPGLYVEDSSTYLSAENMVPGEIREYTVIVKNLGTDCRLHFGVDQIANFTSSGAVCGALDPKLSEAMRLKVEREAEDGSRISLSGGADAGKGELLGDRSEFYMEDSVLMKQDESLRVYYQLCFVGKDGPENVGRRYAQTRMTAAVAVTGVQAN